MAAIRIGFDLGIFDLLVEAAGNPVKTDDIAQKTNAEPEFMGEY